ncbi:SMP-30/gluconolactonase/LRE family protein [Glaciecola sp. 1036]|uniref:SMP-30/gluconolactonase/LRE family protein n=1 Tax=Alteromonadaceae TaxID=72275 RepID=UPI003CFE7525
MFTLPRFSIGNAVLSGISASLIFFSSFIHAQSSPSIDIYDEAAADIILKDSKINLLGDGYAWSEGPVWVESGDFLLFSDVPNNKLYKYQKDTGVTEYLTPSGATGISPHDSSEGSNGLLINADGKLVLMQHGDRRISIMDAPLDNPKANYIPLTSKYQGKRYNSPNDAVFHSNGDLYFTDPPYGLKLQRKDPHKALDFDGIYRLTREGEVILEDKSILYPNGIILSADESFAIVAASDSDDAKWYKFDLNEKGNLVNKRVFFDVAEMVGQPNEPGLPDGMVMHSKGYIFATGPGGVWVFDQTGKALAKIRTGKATANCTLSADEKTLYMTAHDTLMSVELVSN